MSETTKANCPFVTHGMTHISYSAVMMYRSDPAAYLMRYPLRFRSATNANMARGLAAEEGIEKFLTDEFGCTLEEAVEAAVKRFNKDTALVVERASRDKALKDIPEFVRLGIEALEQFGKPVSTQNKLTMDVGVGVPVLGYDDFEFEVDGRKLSVDLKTTGRMPSDITDSHKFQGSLYQAMRPEHDIKFAYVTPKKWAVYDLDKTEARQLFEDFKVSAKKLETFLSLSNDAKELATIFAPSYESFYWSDPMMVSKAKAIFGV
jgi:hypothetical protein